MTTTTTQKRILIATTSHTQLGDTGKPTGAYLAEVAHPHAAFVRAGHGVEFASVRGGQIPLDGVADADAGSRAFLEAHGAELASSQAAASVDPEPANGSNTTPSPNGRTPLTTWRRNA